MSEISYSFIVPHKNSPVYLNKLLNSIPRREDIEIIVVDDASDKEVIDWNTFKYDDERCIKTIKSEKSGGGGYARNLGLKEAKGKWLLFPDADDCYTKGFLSHIDEYLQSAYDVIYFSFNAITNEGESLNWETCSYVEEAIKGTRSVDWVKYKIYAVWCKMIKRSFVEEYGVSFEEVPFSNDRFFTFQIGFFAKSIHLDSYKLYNYIVYPKSQTNSAWTLKKSFARHNNLVKLNPFYKLIGHLEWKMTLRSYFNDMIGTRGIKNKIYFVLAGIMYLPTLYKNRNGYVNKISELEDRHNNL